MRLSHARIANRSSLLLAGACLHWAATAQSASGIWRCGNTYTDRPCHDGQTLPLDEAPGADRQREADQATRQARAEAQRMERERLRLEAAQGPGQATLIDNAPRARAAAPEHRESSMKKGKPRKDPQYLSPRDPSAAPKKKRVAND
ncbi:hypothetical protein QTI33_11585 [Variovorax sp. J22P271]|uniref:hypothetical protein n=1 Tax=Variovorax davisae TaxID=3053515 RepID=UPI002576ED12|nr:hypothetical protein [Variovorax sp. J22P271]MDM0032768.1 hypothetical protein [Variovorax sp. J22P271]